MVGTFRWLPDPPNDWDYHHPAVRQKDICWITREKSPLSTRYHTLWHVRYEGKKVFIIYLFKPKTLYVGLNILIYQNDPSLQIPTF